MSGREVAQAIGSGALDNELDAVISAAVARKRYLQTRKAVANQLELTPGTKVRITSGIKPKYLIGLSGTVSDHPAKRGGDLMFEFDSDSYPFARHRFGRVVGVPASLLERVE